LLKHLRAKNDASEGVMAGAAYHVTYSAFSSMASKSDAMTLRDMFIKMLMTTRGVTGEKAIEIQERWPTPRALIDAFASCGDGVNPAEGAKRKKNMVMEAMAGIVGKRKMTKSVSERIAEIWGDA